MQKLFLSFLHFYNCKIIQFLLFYFSLIQICFRLNKKNFFSNFIFIFSPPPTIIFLKKICKPSIKNKALLLLNVIFSSRFRCRSCSTRTSRNTTAHSNLPCTTARSRELSRCILSRRQSISTESITTSPAEKSQTSDKKR